MAVGSAEYEIIDLNGWVQELVLMVLEHTITMIYYIWMLFFVLVIGFNLRLGVLDHSWLWVTLIKHARLQLLELMLVKESVVEKVPDFFISVLFDFFWLFREIKEQIMILETGIPWSRHLQWGHIRLFFFVFWHLHLIKTVNIYKIWHN